jgi:hypothetical protein
MCPETAAPAVQERGSGRIRTRPAERMAAMRALPYEWYRTAGRLAAAERPERRDKLDAGQRTYMYPGRLRTQLADSTSARLGTVTAAARLDTRTAAFQGALAAARPAGEAHTPVESAGETCQRCPRAKPRTDAPSRDPPYRATKVDPSAPLAVDSVRRSADMSRTCLRRKNGCLCIL